MSGDNKSSNSTQLNDTHSKLMVAERTVVRAVIQEFLEQHDAHIEKEFREYDASTQLKWLQQLKNGKFFVQQTLILSDCKVLDCEFSIPFLRFRLQDAWNNARYH